MKKRTLARTLVGVFLIVAVSAAVSACSSSTEDRLRAENAALMERLAAAEAARDAATAAAEAAQERALEAAAERDVAVAAAEAAVAAQAVAEAAEGEASAARDAAAEAAEAAQDRADAAEAALVVAEAARDEAMERAVAAEEALEELLAQVPGDGGVSIAWGPRLAGSGLSAVRGAEDDFGAAVIGAAVRAARSVPDGGSQSSLVDENGRTADEMSVQAVRDDDGNLVYEVTDGARLVVQVPSSLPRQGLGLALFTDLIPGIEPDLSSYPHEVLGMWAWDVDGGEVGVFWGRSPSVPPVEFGSRSPIGTATYEGGAVGLHAAGGAATKFLADVEMVADFDARTVGGTVEGFRNFAGKSLGTLTVTLGETDFTQQGAPFSGATSAASGSAGVAGSGRWGGRWSDGEGWTMGGTFGFAANDERMAVLGAFTACSCASIGGGNPDDPVSTGP